MANLTQIVYLTQEDYEALLNSTTTPKTYTKGSRTITYDENALYITPETVSTSDLSGILSVSKGGTGRSNLANNHILVGNGTDIMNTRLIVDTLESNTNSIPSSYAVYNNLIKKTGDTMTGNLLGNSTATLGSTSNPFHQLVLGGATGTNLAADSTNPRITFQESNNGTQPVHLIYSDYDSYRSPAGLKVIGGTNATPAWFEVEGNIYAAAFKGNADTATAFSSNKTISLTGDVTGSASSTGGWTIATTASQLSFKNGRIASADLDISTMHSKMLLSLASNNMTNGKPPMGDGYIVTYGWDNAFWGAQHAISHTKTPHMAIRGTSGANTSDWGDWIYLLDASNYKDYAIARTGDTMSGDLIFKTSSADSPDIVWKYGNTDKEQARIWMGSGGTTKWAPLYRCYKSDGTSLYNGTLVLGDGTGASGTWNISVSGTAANVTGTVNIEHGGTGATTSSGALTNLGALPLAGGTMTGALKWQDNSALSEKTTPEYFLVIDDFTNGGETHWSSKANVKSTLLGTNSTHGGAFLRKDGSWEVPPDTKNTAGSINSTSKLYLIGATTQAANPTTNSYQYTYTDNGLLSALKLGLNLNGTEKAHLEWNDTDQSIDFIFA